MEHIISVLVENKSGVLARVAGLFSGRGFNIDSLAVGRTEDESVSRMTIVVQGDDTILEQVTKQLNKMIDVIKVWDLPQQDAVQRELLLVKIPAEGSKRSEILQIADIFGARVVDVTHRDLTLEMTGNPQTVNSILGLLDNFGIKEIVRTGRIAIGRGERNP